MDDRREGEAFVSAILPPYMRKSPKVADVLPILYLRGSSTGDFAPALEGFFGSDAGLSASTVNRLTTACRPSTTSGPAVTCGTWTTSTSGPTGCSSTSGSRMPTATRTGSLLVIVGVRPDGRKELVAVADGYREDTESWLDLCATCVTAAWPRPS